MTERKKSKQLPLRVLAPLFVCALACSESSTANTDAAISTDVSRTSDAAVSTDTPISTDAPAASFFPARGPVFDSTANAARTVRVTASAEAAVASGYPYTATPGNGEAVFADGWSIEFDSYIVVIGSVSLNEPPSDPDMQLAVGPLVATKAGPWAVDLAAGNLPGLDGARAQAIAVFDRTSAGAELTADRQYALSYETAAASANAINLNVPESRRAIWEQMVARGLSLHATGTARYQGRAPSASADSTFLPYPTTVRFSFGFGIPARYVNCHNPSLGEADAPGNRGVKPSAANAVDAQLTFHTDHMFWDRAEIEGAPLRFDHLAARSDRFGMTGGDFLVQTSDLVGVNPLMLVDRQNNPVRDRGAQTSEYDPQGTTPPAFNPNGVTEITDLATFLAYVARAQGHLNADGECAVVAAGPIRL